MNAKGKSAGHNASAAAHRRTRFIDAYLTNGRNQTQAAITAGFSPKTASPQAARLMVRQDVREAIEKRLAQLNAKFDLSIERTLLEVARLAYFDPLKLYDANGVLKKIVDMDADTRAAIASIEVTPIMSRGLVVGTSKKVKHWPKTEALQMAMRYLGLNEKDNAQLHREPIDVTVKFVRAKPRTIEGEAARVIESPQRKSVKVLSSEAAA